MASEETAFEVEAALIDSYPGLTNSEWTYSSERGLYAYEIEYQASYQYLTNLKM